MYMQQIFFNFQNSLDVFSRLTTSIQKRSKFNTDFLPNLINIGFFGEKCNYRQKTGHISTHFCFSASLFFKISI